MTSNRARDLRTLGEPQASAVRPTYERVDAVSWPLHHMRDDGHPTDAPSEVSQLAGTWLFRGSLSRASASFRSNMRTGPVLSAVSPMSERAGSFGASVPAHIQGTPPSEEQDGAGGKSGGACQVAAIEVGRKARLGFETRAQRTSATQWSRPSNGRRTSAGLQERGA
jgi:hypothetical protein